MKSWKAIRRRRGWLYIKQHGEGVSPEEVQLLFSRIIPWAMSMHGQQLKILAFSWDFDELEQGEPAPEYIPRVWYEAVKDDTGRYQFHVGPDVPMKAKLVVNFERVKPVPEGATVSETELKQMMRDPRYWRDNDPEWITKVREGFKKLYPGDGPIGA